MKPFVNIIILNWNNFEDTLECVNSIIKNKYKNYGITIVDNGSTDDSLSNLNKVFSKIDKIKILVSNKNLGFAEGNNFGMRKDLFKKSDFFLLLNNDTIVDKFAIKNMLNEILSKNVIGVISPRIYDYYNHSEISKVDYPGKFNLCLGGGTIDKSGKKFNKQCFVDYTSGCCWLIRRKIYLENKGFNKKYFAYFEEVEWAYRINKSGYKFYLTPHAKIWHKGARTSKNIKGFKLFYQSRNNIWFERQYANTLQYSIFIIILFLYKIPKNILRIFLARKNMKVKLKSYFKGIKEGFTGNYC